MEYNELPRNEQKVVDELMIWEKVYKIMEKKQNQYRVQENVQKKVDTSFPAPFLDSHQTFLQFEFEVEEERRKMDRIFEDFRGCLEDRE